ncbi:MAG TPA: hypothetical protein ENI90_00610 [Methylothermaceae bacterium]|nr:hypothetical protein [Methylothermaceae bacterium]
MRLIVTALGEKGSELFERLLASIRESECKVRECRMTRLGEGCASFLLVYGKWNHIAKLENSLASMHPEERIFFQRLEGDTKDSDHFDGDLLYVADIVTREGGEVLDGLVGFLSQRGIGIQDLRCSSYRLPYVEAMVCTIHLLLRIPHGVPVLSLRDEFLDLCEQMQADAIFEPIKPII